MRCVQIVFLLLFALSACKNESPSHPVVSDKLTVAFTSQPECLLIYVAIANGYFKDQRIDVEPQLHEFGKQALNSLIAQKADIATAAETPIMFQILNDEKIRILAKIVSSTKNTAIVGRRDAGIGALQDLRGKRVAYTPGTTGDFFLTSMLMSNGIARKEIVALALKPNEISDAILSKKIDAAVTWNYGLTKISNTLGKNGVTFYDSDVYTQTFNLVASETLVGKAPQVIERFLRAMIKAEQFTEKNPAQAQVIMQKASGVDIETIKQVWLDFDYKVSLDTLLLLTLEDQTRWALDSKLTTKKKMPDYLKYMYFDGLNAVRPEAITINR